MQQSIKNRLKRLEDAARPPGPMWTIGVDIVEWSGADDRGFGKVVGHIPPRLIEPVEPFDYRSGIAELVAAMGHDDEEL